MTVKWETAATTDDELRSPVFEAIGRVRRVQSDWARIPIAERLQIVGRFRGLLAQRGVVLAEAATTVYRSCIAESLIAEVIPLADACRFLESKAASVLAPIKESRGDRPLWLQGVNTTIVREPFGVVLIIGAANYPCFLAGVQMLQALAAGNVVLVKPARGTEQCVNLMTDFLIQAGAPTGTATMLESDVEAAIEAIELGVDKVLLTGSSATGRAVLRAAAETLTPCTLELAGCDAAFVLPSADVERVAGCLAYALTFNASATCIAPRRVFVPEHMMDKLVERTSERVRRMPPVPVPHEVYGRLSELVSAAVARGATLVTGRIERAEEGLAYLQPYLVRDADPCMKLLQADLFAPVASFIRCRNEKEMEVGDAASPYHLGASVFGDFQDAAKLARRINAGCVTINDVIAPTAHPVMPFGGRGESGYGTTRGAEGLLQLTRPKGIQVRRRGVPPQLREVTAADQSVFDGVLRGCHARRTAARLRGWFDVVSGVLLRGRSAEGQVQ